MVTLMLVIVLPHLGQVGFELCVMVRVSQWLHSHSFKRVLLPVLVFGCWPIRFGL